MKTIKVSNENLERIKDLRKSFHMKNNNDVITHLFSRFDNEVTIP